MFGKIHRSPRAAGFTLLELLVVVAIIALLIGILVPVLGNVRDASKKTATIALCNDVVNAAAQFTVDNRRNPGYFNARDLGAPGNDCATTSNVSGFSNSENVLLDLAGGVVADDIANLPAGVPSPNNASNDPGFTHVHVGPRQGPGSADPVVQVDNAQVGTGKIGGGYLRLKSDNLYVVPGQLGDQNEANGNANQASARGMVDIVDAFGQPLLIWTADESAGTQPEFFALKEAPLRIVQSPPPDEIAPYYWMSNASYLSSNKLGERFKNQRDESILGSENFDQVLDREKYARSLDAIIGSPSFPTTPLTQSDYRTPLRARGSIVVISAGPDQIFFSKKQDPTRGSGNPSLQKVVDYAPTRSGSAPSQSEPSDPSLNEASAFDDVITAGGG